MDASFLVFLFIIFAPAIICFIPLGYLFYKYIKNKKRKNNYIKHKRFKYIAALIGVILGVLYIWGITYIWSNMCGERYSERLYSSDSAYSVQTFEINCGATTGYSTGVILVNEKSIFKNIDYLSVWTDAKNGVFSLNGPLNSVRTSWIDNRTVKVTYTFCLEIREQEKAWKDIKIVYDKQCD